MDEIVASNTRKTIINNHYRSLRHRNFARDGPGSVASYLHFTLKWSLSSTLGGPVIRTLAYDQLISHSLNFMLPFCSLVNVASILRTSSWPILRTTRQLLPWTSQFTNNTPYCPLCLEYLNGSGLLALPSMDLNRLADVWNKLPKKNSYCHSFK